MQDAHDILVVGGGINGAAVARDAAGRGARVLLVEQNDLAAHTSSASTKLIHGGLRYLEQFEFRLVGEALAERERLLHAAPHLIRPLEFVLPHERSMRPGWMMRLGLFLYDRLGGASSLARSHAVRLDRGTRGAPLQPQHRRGYVYWDCWGDDSRLVVANAADAAQRGAAIRTRTRLLSAERKEGRWQAEIEGPEGIQHVSARALVNATGAWAADFLPQRAKVATRSALRLIKGSHIVTRRLFDGDHAYLLQNPDKRVVFAIPYEGAFTLIGTTDVAWDGALDRVEIDAAETDYLCESVNRWLRTPISAADVVWSYAGLRPLYDDAEANPSAISRDYVLSLDAENGQAPVLSIFGGKITTHRALANRAVDQLAPFLPLLGAAWTDDAVLPGGDLGAGGLSALVESIAARAPFLDGRTARRLAESYGTSAYRVLGGATSASDLGEAFGAGLTEAEVEYLLTEEWAQTAEDILWRRSKLGLHMTPEAIARLTAYVEGRAGATRQTCEQIAGT
ncbi:glycerol-3-phosphate dehydrogenase [Sphingomonas hengshuiensis]|uniref:glycerol-3-phosphate dehydrogenase n=1 Tax=Sphingomonas hengshuiensis TaxID=1609977 RepID=UPI0005CA4D8C|nr:glycerol-3-phosphate dehydrogenase [Sphingomonas hengshuiensis]